MKKSVPKEVYRLCTSNWFPSKLAKKFFLPSMKYEDVTSFCSNVDFVGLKDFKSFSDRFGVRRPEKECMIVHGRNDFFSSRSYAQDLMSSAFVTEIDAGSFGFYEKPQEFNKMLHDFLIKMERKILKEEVEEKEDRNKTLKEFESRELAEVHRE
jgi:hypothetical protein